MYHTWYCLRKEGMEIKTTSIWKARVKQLFGWKLMNKYYDGIRK